MLGFEHFKLRKSIRKSKGNLLIFSKLPYLFCAKFDEEPENQAFYLPNGSQTPNGKEIEPFSHQTTPKPQSVRESGFLLTELLPQRPRQCASETAWKIFGKPGAVTASDGPGRFRKISGSEPAPTAHR